METDNSIEKINRILDLIPKLRKRFELYRANQTNDNYINIIQIINEIDNLLLKL